MKRNKSTELGFQKLKTRLFKIPRKSPVKRKQAISYKHATKSGRSVFSWTATIKNEMASYLRDNFGDYKSSLRKGQKIRFLRKTRDFLGISESECDDKQLKNGFESFLRKYTEIKDNLNSSGFGIDPEKDSSLDKGWILCKCPYFNLIDEVMATRPNIVPPCIIESSLPHGDQENVYEGNALDEVVSTKFEPYSVPDEDVADTLLPKAPNTLTDQQGHSAVKESSYQKEDKEAIHQLIKRTLGGVDAKTKSPKNALAAFSMVMEKKIEEEKLVEKEKIGLEQQKFEYMKRRKRNDFELEKLKTESEIQNQKKLDVQLELELKELEDKQQQRGFELKKLELEIELAKLRQANQN